MQEKTAQLVNEIKNHRSFSHPVFEHWAQASPAPTVLGAMFHQIQCFCASTRPGLNFPAGLRAIGQQRAGELVEEIVASESGHGKELATMAAYIINRAAGYSIFPDVYDQAGIEKALKESSDEILGNLPYYDSISGLTVQAREAIAVFERRECLERESTLRSLGSALALEMISNHHLIPGERRAIVESGMYGVALSDPEMHYLDEHWGELGAEQKHESNILEAVDAVINGETQHLIAEGVTDVLESLARLWDVIDVSLLGATEGGAR